MKNVKDDSKNYKFNPYILRAYDIRGIVGETLSEEDAYYLGRSLAAFVLGKNTGKKICIGFDGRFSSPKLEEKIVRGLMESGMDVIRIGLCPTPMLYFSVKHLGASGGIMITGSHNPPSHNGFKMMLEKLPVYGDDIQELGSIAERGDFLDGKGSVSFEDVKDAYMKHLLKAFAGGRELKIAWDAGNGATGNVMKELTENLPGKHFLLNEKIDGNFPSHHPDPSVAENMEQLIEMVEKEHCDLGIAFDGDGDRIGVVDNQGRIIWGDQLMSFFAEDILQKHKGETIIADVKASQTLFDEIARNGGKPLMWKTGHSLIKTKMFETRAILAGEMSGHVFFKDNNGFDDGLYAAIQIINIVSKSKEPLSKKLDALPHVFNTPEIRVDVDDAKKFTVVEAIKISAKKDGLEVNDIDGVRVRLDGGWWLVRASNTQAALVVRCEANSQNRLTEIKTDVFERLASGGIKIS